MCMVKSSPFLRKMHYHRIHLEILQWLDKLSTALENFEENITDFLGIARVGDVESERRRYR